VGEPTLIYLVTLFQPSAPGHERMTAFYSLATVAQLAHWEDVGASAFAEWPAPPEFGFTHDLGEDS
jgi:hypothetical protein